MQSQRPRTPPFLSGGGELAGLIAAFPWKDTALGPIERWPSHVRHTVALMMRSDLPMVALFGEAGTMIYNDGYSVFAGGRHPRLLGSPVREGWPEVADFNDHVMRTGLSGHTLSYKDQELTLFRRGVAEQVWMNLDYSPVLDDAGRPDAVLAIVVERVTRGLIEIERAPVVLQDVVHSALEQARPALDARHHALSVDLPPHDVPVLGDQTRLVQVLVNLITNAAKYTPPGGSIRVQLAHEGARARLSVRDNGAGIEPALLPHVFELFTQGERTPDRSQGGLGIGLALVKSIVELHGGEAWADSEGKGHGSRFSIALPLAVVQAGQAPGTAAKAQVARPLRVLVTDDNADAADSLGALLTVEGHEVLVAYTGGEALAAVDRMTPDVAILDIGLPDITGLELARELRGRPALHGLLLVALTGYGQAEDRTGSAAAGFDHHLVKPVAPGDLHALLSRHAPAAG